VTYNIRTLSGLDRKGRESDPFGNTVSSEEEPSPHFSHVSQTRSTVLNLAVGPNEIRKGRSHTAKYFRKLLQEREIRGRQALGPMRATASSQIKLWKSWKGASNDVNTVAWSPDGTRFAAGATTQSDVYNRSNNLVLGDLVRSSLDELPDHWTHWTPGSAPASTTDPRCFSSVSAVQWLGERLYSASYDQTVKIWDVETTPRASCLQTLKHDSEVVVMALSSWMPRYLATGAQGFVLWNTTDTSAPIQLPILRSTLQKAQINLTPTALMWGQSPAMSRFLVGGMAQPLQDTEKISQHGHLGLWKLEEAGVTTRKLTPDSQNIFDIKWHPFMSRFVTASTPGVSSSLKLPRGYRSVVRMYEYEATGDNFKATTEFACPALDINEVTMCPMSTAYVTASCTDGSTYVWDNRNPGRILHKLQHGSSSTPLQHGVDREISDFGVRVALWGSTMDQFYTGGSDCYLKQWDIRRSPDDVLVANTAKFGHDIVSGAFSEDKTQLLIGDYGGGIHVLSCSPCADPDATKFNFNHAPQPVAPSNEQNGVTLANELVASGQLMMHRRYGPVQGPNYTGPFSRWARGLSTDEPKPETIAEIPLLEECQLRQFDGPKVKHRLGLDEKGKKEVRNEMKKAKVRNGRYSRSVTTSSQMEARIKRERRSRSISVPHELKRRRTESGESSRVITNTDPVDLTEDSDVESLGLFDLSPWEKLLENLEDDFYYPENRSLDPNFPKDE
jgi:WD40 repeat protein